MVRARLISFFLLFFGCSIGAGVPYNAPRPAVHKSAEFDPVIERRGSVYESPMPQWPFFGKFFAEPTLLEFDFGYSRARKALDEAGDTVDVAVRAFGKNPIPIYDTFLVTRLLKNDRLHVGSSHVVAETDTTHTQGDLDFGGDLYLKSIASEEFDFHAKTDQEKITVRGACAAFKDKVFVGFEIPIARRSNVVSLESSLSSIKTAALQALQDTSGNTNKFLTNYPNALESFLKDILGRKKIDKDMDDAAFGVGNITLFCNIPVELYAVDVATVGAHLILPTARVSDQDHVWPSELGNGGFLEVGCSLGLMWEVWQTLNPHLFMYARYAGHSKVYRRIPRTVKYAGEASTVADAIIASILLNDGLVCVGDGLVAGRDFEEADSNVRGFANEVRCIAIKKGVEIGARFGNIFKDIFYKHLNLDVYYSLDFKASDKVDLDRDHDAYDGNVFTEESYRLTHELAGTLSYRYRDYLLGRVGASYVFAGRNAFKDLAFNIGFEIQF
ncbi:hypothetical protein HOD08_03700 [bacterium]|nr:hypothetical protein [bacterium]